MPRVSRIRPLVVLAIFLAIWWLAPVAVRSFSRLGLSDFEAPVWLAYSHLKDLQDFWSLRDHSQDELIEAGRDLARENAFLSQQLQQDDALHDEVKRLEGTLQMPPEPGFRYEFARVVRREETTWWQHLIIRKGRRDGIAIGQGVVFAGGVVGRVKQVDDFTAVVEMASSPAFRVAANLGQDSRPVTYQGRETPPLGLPGGEVRDVHPEVVISKTNVARLVTSNLGGIFPQGLTIGWIEKLELGSDGLFQSGTVKLDSRLSTLHEVAVLIPESAEAAPILPKATTPTPQRTGTSR